MLRQVGLQERVGCSSPHAGTRFSGSFRGYQACDFYVHLLDGLARLRGAVHCRVHVPCGFFSVLFPGVFRTRWSGVLLSSSLRRVLRSSGFSRFRGTHAVPDLVQLLLQGFAGGTSACARASSCSRVSEVDEREKLGGFVPAGFATACRRGTDPDRARKHHVRTVILCGRGSNRRDR